MSATIFALAGLAACSESAVTGAPGSATVDDRPRVVPIGRAPRVMPLRPPGGEATRRTAATAAAAHLSYGGGPVLANVEVHVLLWGPNVDANVLAQLGDYFTAISNSPYQDMLGEYATPTQQIGAGTFAGFVTDPNPPPKTTVTDDDIQNEVLAASQNLGLPAPDGNSLTFVLFPPGFAIDAGRGEVTCQTICGYHYGFREGSANFYYAVIPDMGGGCSQGCGTSNKINNTDSVISHEYAEAITDPGAGSGWYDFTTTDLAGGGEIADICDNGFGDTAQVSGFTVQLLWSNEANACIALRPPGDNDYSIVLDTNRASLPLGASTTVALDTAVTVGASEPISLTVSGMPHGVTATVSPSTINSGEIATITINAAADADQVRAALDVSAAFNADFGHDTSLVVTIGNPGDFALDITPKSRSVALGGTATYTVTTALLSQPIGNIDLEAIGLPAGVKATFDPVTVAPGGTSMVTLVTSDTAQGGTGRFQVQGSVNATIHATNALIAVAGPDAAVAPVLDATPRMPAPDASPGDNPGGSCALAGPASRTASRPAGLVGLALGLCLSLAALRRRRART